MPILTKAVMLACLRSQFLAFSRRSSSRWRLLGGIVPAKCTIEGSSRSKELTACGLARPVLAQQGQDVIGLGCPGGSVPG